MKHIWWATILTIWLAVGGWVTLTVSGKPHMATSVAHSGFALAGCCAALLLFGLFGGALDD